MELIIGLIIRIVILIAITLFVRYYKNIPFYNFNEHKLDCDNKKKINGGNLKKLLIMCANIAKKATVYIMAGLIALTSIIMFGSYILDFILNNIIWTVGALGLLLVLILVISNWDKIKKWSILEKINLAPLGIILYTISILFLIISILYANKFFLNLASLSLITGMLLGRISKSLIRINKKEKTERPNLFNEIFYSGKFGFIWTPTFIAVTGLYLTIFIIN